MSISLCFAVFAMIRASPLRFIRTILPCAEGTRKAVFLRFSCMKKHPAPLFGKAGPIGKGTLLQQRPSSHQSLFMMTVRVSDERSSRFLRRNSSRVAARIQKRLLRKRMKTGGVYLGFHTLRGRKFPYGNFRTSVFCEVKTQIVGKTIVFRQSRLSPLFPDIINILRRETK